MVGAEVGVEAELLGEERDRELVVVGGPFLGLGEDPEAHPTSSTRAGALSTLARRCRRDGRRRAGTGRTTLTNSVGDRLLKRVNRAIARQSELPLQPFYEPSDFPWVAPIEADWKTDPGRARRAARVHRRAPELPGHQHRPVQPHRRRQVEDVLLLRLRVSQRRQLRAVSRDHAADRDHPGDGDGDVLDPRPAASASRPTTAPTRACCATTWG